MSRQHLELLISLFLIVSTLTVYWQVKDHEFVDYDDYVYVTKNRHVQAGLTGETIIWAFTATLVSNWHPMTWISYMLDYEIYGLSPKGYHLTNLLFHIMNTLLLFLVFKRMTGALWQSAFVASLFALHPLHVESVAWVAERKDVLSTFFWMLTMWAYIYYVERPEIKRYLLILLAFVMGLMSKPMLVTLPFVLLLLDYWPLGRLKFAGLEKISSLWGSNRKILLEKTPFLALTVLSSVITYFVQQKGGAVSSFEQIPLGIRIANSFMAYISYIYKTIWPRHLTVLYPHPGDVLPVWQGVSAGFILVCLSLLAIPVSRRRPYIASGWFWYVGTLVPVIGLVQVGAQSMADRYMYVPLIGLSIIIAWGIPDLMANWRYRKIFLTVSAGVILSAFMVCTLLQVRYWHNGITLFRRAVDSTSGNYVAHNRLGVALSAQGKIQEALHHYSKAVQIKPNYATAHYDMAVDLASMGKLNKAIKHYYKTIRIKPGYEDAHFNLGVIFTKQGKIKKAVHHYLIVLRINPENVEAHNNLGLALARQGKIEDAIAHFSEALSLKPDYEKVRNNLGKVLIQRIK